MIVRELKAADLLYVGILDEAQGKAIVTAPRSYAVTRENGDVVACAGIVEYWEGRGEIWISVGKLRPGEFVALHRVAKRFVDLQPLTRLEVAVETDNERGLKWMKMLGFEFQSLAKKYFPNGKDCWLLAKVG